jgi:butyryl-CoA dehydrogenase
MDFSFSDENLSIAKVARAFATRELAAGAAERDRTGDFPLEIVRKMGEAGLMGISYPEEWGGLGADSISHMLAMEEVSYVDAAMGSILGAHYLGSDGINLAGTDEQKEKYLRPAATGEKLAAFALTEPGAGSDVGAMSTTAIRKGDRYILNGVKHFITNGGVADFLTVCARLSPAEGAKGLTGFIVDTSTLGFKVGTKEDKMGIRSASTWELVFEDCEIPVENRLGEEGAGFRLVMSILDRARVEVAAMAVGMARASFDAAVKYAEERVQFGKPIIALPAIRDMLADMATEIDAARFLVYRAAWLKDREERITKEASMAKLYSAEVAMRAAHKAVQIHGGYGYMKDYAVERYFRDARILEIFEGTSQIQRIVISNHLTKVR